MTHVAGTMATQSLNGMCEA